MPGMAKQKRRPGYMRDYMRKRRAREREALTLMDILQLLEPGEYPEGTDTEMAVLSIAVSLKRLADQGEGQVVNKAPAGRRVVGAQPAKTAARGKRSVGKADPPEQPEFPDVDIPAGFVPWPGGECPILPDEMVKVIWRNGKIQHNAAQSFHWEHGATGKPDFDILAYRQDEPDPALTEKQR